MTLNQTELARMIDHTILKPEATQKEVEIVCSEAIEYRFASVCVNPSFVHLAADILKGSDVKVCTVVGFPLGATTTRTKAFETEEAIQAGASEIDMVINVGRLRGGDNPYVIEDIETVARIVHKYNALLKVIIETCLLTDAEKVKACTLAVEGGADFVKTSTGFNRGGATIEDVILLRKAVGEKIGVKASGGIRRRSDALAMISAGANRIGTSSSVKIVTETE
ncbi:MAG: deoxyribose-phosphate aldolase [Candidatus Kryptoniota bacterium]